MGSPPVQGLLLNRRWVTREQYLKFEKERENKKIITKLKKETLPCRDFVPPLTLRSENISGHRLRETLICPKRPRGDVKYSYM